MTRKLVLAFGVIVLVVSIGVSRRAESAPALPETTSQFSLDLSVTDTLDHDVVFAVEQRARPFYRILSFDPEAGTAETVFTVPEDAIIYGIALSPDRSTLAVAYSPDFHLDGNGLWMLNLDTDELTETIAVTTDLYLTDIAWSTDGDSVYATQVDRRADEELLAAVRVPLSQATVEVLATDAINPVEVDGDVFVLDVDEEGARRSISQIDDGARTTLDIGGSDHDLDHLTVGQDESTLLVAVLDSSDGGLTFGQPAEAHGNHDVSSSWWTIDLDGAAPVSRQLEPIIVYDAVATFDAIVYATNEGLAFGTDVRTDVIKSRAIRFVAA